MRWQIPVTSDPTNQYFNCYHISFTDVVLAWIAKYTLMTGPNLLFTMATKGDVQQHAGTV